MSALSEIQSHFNTFRPRVSWFVYEDFPNIQIAVAYPTLSEALSADVAEGSYVAVGADASAYTLYKKMGSQLVTACVYPPDGVLSVSGSGSGSGSSGISAEEAQSMIDASLVGYVTSSDLANAVAGKLKRVSVAALPDVNTADMNTVYLVPSQNPESGNIKDEYMVVETTQEVEGEPVTTRSWELVGGMASDVGAYTISGINQSV